MCWPRNWPGNTRGTRPWTGDRCGALSRGLSRARNRRVDRPWRGRNKEGAGWKPTPRTRARKGHMEHWTAVLAQDAAKPAADNSKRILDYIADGGPLSYVLVFLSFVAVALMIRNAI